MSPQYVKYEIFEESTETPLQRNLRRVKSSVYVAIALIIAIASVLGVLNPIIGT
jgi:hypothetical protein